MNDDVHVEYNADKNASDFLDAMAKALAESLKFANHGPLTESEQTAFLWGFRYGIHQINALLQQASGRDEKTFIMICEIMTHATAEWRLKATAQIAAVIPLDRTHNKTEH
jgi:hypothetical protein